MKAGVAIKIKIRQGKCLAMAFLLECPKCGNRMKYQPAKAGSSSYLSAKIKKCVYCNFSFGVQKSVVKGL